MKKESKELIARSSRFIFLLLFSLLIVDRIFAQCTGTDISATSCTSCTSAVDMSPSCSSCYLSPHLTDLKTTGVGPTTSVTISGSTFPGITSMTVTTIQIYDNNCVIVPAPGSPFTSATFPTMIGGSPTNISFQNFDNHVTVSIPSGQTINSALLGYTINFVVNVLANGSTTSRNYFFKITNTSYIVGDPHITTPDGVHYDFQSAGEFIALRGDSSDNFEIQTRHTPVATNGPGTDSYTGLSTCVSLITAVAARVGTHHVSYEPNINGQPDSSGMQLRVDGVMKTLDGNGLDLGSGSRILKSSAGAGIEIDFPNGAYLVVTSNWWSAYSVWYLNVQIYRNTATRGIMGVIAPKSWLPKLPDGSSVGPMPRSVHDRFVQLYGTFANAWRVTDKTSLFDYASGTSTATFTNSNWPSENAQSCSISGQTPLQPITLGVAQQLCSGILDSGLKANAIFDVMVTGEAGFAKAYLLTQQVETGTTVTTLNTSKDTTKYEEPVTFTATVTPKFVAGKSMLTDSVEFTVDGEKLAQVKLDATGHAVLTTTALKVGQHQIVATYIPSSGSTVFSSSSPSITQTVIAGNGSSILHEWWFWVIIIIVLILIWLTARKKKP